MPAPLRNALPILLVFAVAGFLLLAHLGTAPLDEAEARSAIVSRSILNGGSWLFPVPERPFACDKSPLVYWQAVPVAWVAGGMTELAARLPSALWALALLIFTWDIARRWHDGLTAVLAAGALATSFGFIHWGRHGTAEMAQAATIFWCLWYFVKHWFGPGRRWLYVLAVLMGLAANFGAREAYGVVILSLIVLSAVAKDWAWLRPARSVVLALFVSFAVFLAPPLMASLATGSAEPLGALWREHVLRHLQPPSQAFAWRRELWRLLELSAPWVVLLPIEVWNGYSQWRRGGRALHRAPLLAAAAAAWLMLSSSGEPRHLLAVVPLVSITAARLVAHCLHAGASRLASGAIRAIAFLMGLSLIGQSTCLLHFAGIRRGLEQDVLTAAIGLAMMLGAVVRRRNLVPVAAAAVWFAWLASGVPGPPEAVREQVARVAARGKAVAFVGRVPAQVAFYLDGPYEFLDGPSAAQEWAEATGGTLIASAEPAGGSWQFIADGRSWRALAWSPRSRAVALTRDPAWLARHPLRGIESEELAYAFKAEAGLRLDLGTVTMRLFRQEGQEGRELAITAESRGGVPGYKMASTITSRLRESDLGQIDVHDLRTSPSYKHRRFTWLPDGVDYHRHGHCKDKACREPSHMVSRESDGALVHCAKDGCKQVAHYVWRLREAFRGPNALWAWHIIAASYVARGLPLAPGAPPQRIRVVNNHQMWDVALRAVEEKTIEVPAGKFQCYRLAFDPTPLNEEAKESADEAEGPFGLTGHADLYVDKETKLLVLLDGQIALGATFKVKVLLTRREVVPASKQE